MLMLSASLRTAMMTNYGMAIMMQYGCIQVFSGPQPVSADAAVQGASLGAITQDGLPFTPRETTGGLQLRGGELAGSVVKQGSWVFTGSGSGTPGWWRFVWNGFDGGTSADDCPRIDGLVGESLILPFSTVEPDQTETITDFKFYLPPYQLT